MLPTSLRQGMEYPKTDSQPGRTIKDITRTLQVQFSAPKTPHSLPAESRRLIQSFVDEHDGGVSEEESARANSELRTFWERYVGENPQKLALFVGVLKELRPAIKGEQNILEWSRLIVKRVVGGAALKKTTFEDAQDFLIGVMVGEHDDEDAEGHDTNSRELLDDLLSIYLARTNSLTDDEDDGVAVSNAQVSQQVEDVVLTFGRKKPRTLFQSIAKLATAANTRLQALTLLSSFLRNQTPHLYVVQDTPLVEDLLKCLMNDTSTMVLSVALTSLIMLLPHIPGSLTPHLPRLFLVYSRLLCWEKFSPLSSEAQRSTVTDDRISSEDAEDIGIDPSWEIYQPQEGMIEANTPELLTYFTYLYGLYPLNLMSYIRKPRRYLKDLGFPGADAFDLDQAVIRSRTDQYRQMHLLHPNFYSVTVEDELVDPKWPKMDPADVVGECHSLCVSAKQTPASPGPPPTSKLPEVPPLPTVAGVRTVGQLSPSPSHMSLQSGSSWRDTQSTAVSTVTADGDSPILGPQLGRLLDTTARFGATHTRTPRNSDDLSQPAPTSTSRSPQEKVDSQAQTNLAYLQREITLLRNELNFERWHKAQYSQHISQIMRKNVKEATVEAETLNLINANRALKKQLDQARKAREATAKDSALTRKQANNIENNMTDRFNKLKIEQETWQSDADELRRLRSEVKQYRELLVSTEARELNKSHQLELAQRDLEQYEKVKAQLHHAQRKVHEYEYREFEYDSTKRQKEILQRENDDLQSRLQQQEGDRDRLRSAYANKVNELEARLEIPGSPASRGSDYSTASTQVAVQQAVANSNSKLAQLKKAHTRLMEKYTDLELEYHSIRAQLETSKGNRTATFFNETDDRGTLSFDTLDPEYDVIGEYETSIYGTVSSSEPSTRGYRPPIHALGVLPDASRDTVNPYAGITFQPRPQRAGSIASRSTGTPTPAAYNQSAPLSREETTSAFSDQSGTGSQKKQKIQPDSAVRVYGRGTCSDTDDSLRNLANETIHRRSTKYQAQAEGQGQGQG